MNSNAYYKQREARMARYVIHRVDVSEPEIKTAFTDLFCVYRKIHSPVDAVVAIPTRAGFVNVFCEAKKPLGPKGGGRMPRRATKAERDQAEFLRTWPGPIELVRTAADAIRVVHKYQAQATVTRGA